ncbi:MAG TPA: sigma-70 family RNA polymerase sigma factor [Bryobacteraceae bacterium]|nr:sigma-70 family RNA polymerase sigma factor [Bryobacteraceae bacterium]
MLFVPFILAAMIDGDTELVLRLQRREPDALGELYDRYGRLVYSLILRVVRDSGTAEDLVQETFIRVWNRVQSFDAQKGSIAPWILAVARNRAIDYLRSAQARHDPMELNQMDHPSLYSEMESDLLNRDSARRVQTAMQKLPESQRQVIELAYFEGMSQSEMAERMGQPLGTIKTWVRTALRVLREELSTAVTA